MLHTAASCSLSVTSSVNGRRLAAVRAAFAVVVTTCSSLQVRVQLGKRAIAAVLVLGVRGVVYVHRLVLGFQPHRCGLKESKICVRNQRFKGSIGSKSPLRGGRKKVEKKALFPRRFSDLVTGCRITNIFGSGCPSMTST